MALTTAQIIQIRCPNLYSDSALNIWVALAQEQLSSCFFGNNYNLAVALKAAHMYTLTNRNGGSGDAGVIASKSEGGLSVSYVVSSNSDEDLGQTSFGLELAKLMKSSGAAASVTGAAEAGFDLYCE
jgi:hypothetical protein